jgi:hypothetical protein
MDVLHAIASNFGSTIFNYFDGFLCQVRSQFKQDDLMVEGFTDVVSAAQVVLQVVPKEQMKSGYSECRIDNGSVVLRTTPAYWGTNANYVAMSLSKLL